MKLSILLPYKENFSHTYPGAVSLFINDTSLTSKYKKFIKVYGSTEYKNLFKIRYQNIDLPKRLIGSQTRQYINEFIKYIASKGSVCIDGVSLTVNDVEIQNFSVNIIPHTWSNTNFNSYKVNTNVNIEIDILSRYLEKLNAFN